MKLSFHDWAIENNPQLLLEWGHEKNLIEPSEISYGSSREKVWWNCEQNHIWEATPYNRRQGKGCPYCSERLFDPNRTSVAIKFPNLLKYWSSSNKLSPEEAPVKNKYKWFCLKCQLSWMAKPTKTMNCPYCQNKRVAIGFNDLETTHPELIEQLIDPKLATVLTAGSRRKIEWQCNEGHRWSSEVALRAKGAGCPYCVGTKIKPGFNDFATLYPDLAKQWSSENNGYEIPNTLISSSSDHYWWRCEYSHLWSTSIASRTQQRGCRICVGKELTPGINDLKTSKPQVESFYRSEAPFSELFTHDTKMAKWECAECSINFNTTPHSIGKLPYCKECRAGCSQLEKEITNSIKKIYHGEIISNTRDVIKPYELDIYIPDKKLAIEINGDYWHSDKILLEAVGETAQKRHSRKIELCKEKDVKLCYIWESDWKDKRSIIEGSLILLFTTGDVLTPLTKLEGSL